jgi:hypothetical protein
MIDNYTKRISLQSINQNNNNYVLLDLSTNGENWIYERDSTPIINEGRGSNILSDEISIIDKI